MSEIREVVDGVVVQPEQPSEIPSPQTAVFPEGFLDEVAISQVTGLETDSERAKYKDEIQNIIKWAKLEGYETHEQLKWMVRKLQDRLGTPPLTERWITRLNRFAVLELQQKRIQAEQDSLMKGFDNDPGQ